MISRKVLDKSVTQDKSATLQMRTSRQERLFKPRSRRLGGFLICLRFFFFRFVCNYIQTSADDVIISQLQAISQLFSSYPLSGEFC